MYRERQAGRSIQINSAAITMYCYWGIKGNQCEGPPITDHYTGTHAGHTSDNRPSSSHMSLNIQCWSKKSKLQPGKGIHYIPLISFKTNVLLVHETHQTEV